MKMQDAAIRCAVCGDVKLGRQHWFLLAENRWEDKLKILLWDDTLATQAGVFALCSALHLREMVAHWMIAGTLNPILPSNYGLAFTARYLHDPDTAGGQQIGELTVHHESMKRLLVEQPHSLKPVLDALLSALEDESLITSPVQHVAEPLHPALSQSVSTYPLLTST